ncbi:hypothetical protein Sru01_68370 [Sphaerisporangium rufum]|uniref:Uncharacterized protein n=1 Tax=Sphaerisporangium rufum TaxID=1381558 RepID=A0A919V8Z4_9ACTN|nr:hypothetical protein [Sphaerisporangium rufum]GII81855.1 hypothetical protein Sru01_68370 [Sphaerisporangium rufum]
MRLSHRRAVLGTGATGLVSLLTLVEASTPGLSYWALALAPCWPTVVIALVWPAREPGPGGRRWRWRPWLLIPVAMVSGTVSLVVLDAPLRARFALSEPSLSRHARSVREDDQGGRRWWGLYRVSRVEKIPGGARFMVTSLTTDWRSYGFAYHPGRAPDPAEGVYEHFSGPWYVWSDGP